MGVLACDRRGCESVMCDYFSHRFGYLCHSCLQEAKDLNISCDRDMEIFMNTSPRPYQEENTGYLNLTFEAR